jgi:nucleoside-diphosphate-sugar epimerase
MNKTILIIGANSALAKEVIPVLAKGNTVITAGRKDCDLYCDVTKAVTVPDEVDVIINFAATFGGASDEEIIDAQRTNVTGALNVCVGGKRAGVKHIINISSIFALLDEKSPHYSVYALTKKQADELAHFYCGINKIPLTILRPSQIYGDSDNFAKHQPFLYHILDKAQKGEDISIYGTNDALRNYIHSADLSEIVDRLIEKRVEGMYACAYPSDISYSQIAQAAQKIFGKGGKVVFLKDKPNIPDNIFMKDLSLYEKLEYYPQISIEAGIKRIKERKGGSR